MIHLKNRSRETRTYQYPRNVSAGPVRPQTQTVFRTKHNPKNGEVSQREEQITLGGVLTLAPKAEMQNLPDALLEHPALQRDIRARLVSVRKLRTTAKATAAPVEKAAPAVVPTQTTTSKKRSKSRR